MPNSQKRHHAPIAGLIGACLVAVAVVATSRKSIDTSTNNSSGDVPKKNADADHSQPNLQMGREEVAGFRLLVTILSGVSLGAAASALPSLMSRSTTVQLFVAIWLLWTTGVFVIVLTYLSTLTGAKIIPLEIDLWHTATFTVKTVANADCSPL